jgi:hypothetical protein
MRIRRTLLALALAITFVGASVGVSAGVASADGKGHDRCTHAAARIARLQKKQQHVEEQAAPAAGGVRAQKFGRRAARIDAELAKLQAGCQS